MIDGLMEQLVLQGYSSTTSMKAEEDECSDAQTETLVIAVWDRSRISAEAKECRAGMGHWDVTMMMLRGVWQIG